MYFFSLNNISVNILLTAEVKVRLSCVTGSNFSIKMDEKLSCIQYSEAAVLMVAPPIAGVAHEDGSDGGEVSHSREDGGMADDAAQVS